MMLRALSLAVVVAICSCGGNAGSDLGKEWTEVRPPALGCETNVPAGVDPAVGAIFQSDHMLCVKIQMDPADYEKMNLETRFGAPITEFDEVLGLFFLGWGECDTPWPDEFTWYHADVEVDGVKLADVGIRKKGFLGSIFSTVPSVKVKTDKYSKGQFLGDTERLTLNNNSNERTRMVTCLTYDLVAAAGYPGVRCNLANVMVNGEPLGAYIHVESIKKRFLERAFGDASGSLYEGTMADLIEEVLPRWEVKTDSSDKTRQPLLDLALALQKPDDELVAALSPLLNIERFVTFWALEVLVKHSDGYSGDTNNFYVYFDPTDDNRAVFLHWGVDKTFMMESKEDGAPSLEYYLTALVPGRLAQVPEVAKQMEDELARLMDEVWNEQAILASIDTYAALVRTAQNDDAYEAELAELRTWVKNRPQEIMDLLDQGIPTLERKPFACGGGK